MTELNWETIDAEAPYPKPVQSAKGVLRYYDIAHYRIGRDDKKFDCGPVDNWTLSVFAPTSGHTSYHSSLEAAEAEANRVETAH